MESPERMYLQEAYLQERQVRVALHTVFPEVLPLAQDYLPYVAVPADA